MDDKIVDAILVFLGTVFTGMMAYFMAKLNSGATKAAEKVQVVADKLVVADRQTATKLAENEAKLQAISVVADITHALSNSKMLRALDINRKVTKRLAEMTKDPVDAALAEQAETQYQEHKSQQDKVDKKYPAGVPDASGV